MAKLVCPHCKSHPVVTSHVPENVVAMLPCPACHEYSVFFRSRLFPLDRHLLEGGDQEARVAHIAHIIAQILDEVFGSVFRAEPGAKEVHTDFPAFLTPDNLQGLGAVFEDDEHPPITDEEFSKFVRIDLKCLDSADYFKRHFSRE